MICSPEVPVGSGGEDESGTSGVSRGRCEQVDDHIDKLAIQVVLNFVYQQVASVP